MRTNLLSGGFLVLLPVLAFAGLVVREHVTAERARIEAEARGLVRAVAGAVDREAAGADPELEQWAFGFASTVAAGRSSSAAATR